MSGRREGRDGYGVAYGDLLFQHDFAAGENPPPHDRKTEAVSPVFPVQAFARYIPERSTTSPGKTTGSRIASTAPVSPRRRQPDRTRKSSSAAASMFGASASVIPLSIAGTTRAHFYHKYDSARDGHVQRWPDPRLRRHGHLGWAPAVRGRNYASWKILANVPFAQCSSSPTTRGR